MHGMLDYSFGCISRGVIYELTLSRTYGRWILWISEEMAKRTIQSVPLGRLGTPEEIAGLAYYLCSDEVGT